MSCSWVVSRETRTDVYLWRVVVAAVTEKICEGAADWEQRKGFEV